MKDKVKKIVGWRPSPVVYVCASALFLALLLVPLLRLTGYAVPWYDDYTYGRYAKTAMEQDNSLWKALAGAWECIRMSWHAWQGTYSSIFFMVLMPGIWGESYYFLGPVFLILFLTVSVILLVYGLLRMLLKAEKPHAWGIAFVSAAMVLVMVHTAQEGFYWYNGGVHYIGMHSFLMLLVVLTVKLLLADKKRTEYGCMFAAMGFAFIAAGGNLVTSLQGILLLCSIAVWGIWQKNRYIFRLVPVLAVYLGGFIMNMTAPGNDKRAKNFEGWGMSPVKAILCSFKEGAEYAWEFTGAMTIIFLMIMLPLIYHMVKKVSFPFRYPGLVTIWSVCLYATGFTPSLYSLGHAGLGRTLNAVKITWQLLLIGNLVYWCGWLVRKRPKTEGRMCRWWWYALAAIAAWVVFYTEPNQAGSFSSYGAYYYVHTGEAYNFYQEYEERVRLLNSDSRQVVFRPYNWRPWFLCMGDLSDNPEDEANRSLAAWYDKDSIVCETSQ